jgi:acyl carrier protein
MAIAMLCLDYIDWVEILFALEDRYDIELDDSILDLIAAGPRAIAEAIIEHVAQRTSRSEESP